MSVWSSRLTEEQVMRTIRVAFVISLPLLLFGTAAAFSPDSWTAYEISNTVFGDFYRENTAREYSTGGFYSSAFPPLWPVIMALFKPVTGNIYGSVLAAFVAYGLFALAAERFGRRAFGQRGIGLLSALLLAQFTSFRGELVVGRDRPLLMFELAVAGTLLVGLGRATWQRAALLGFVAGAMVMTRFDALPMAAVILAGAVVLGVRRANILVLVAAFAIAISPWVIYSRTHFGVSFASSNKWTAISVARGDVYDYHVKPPQTLYDAPRAWVRKVVNNVVPIAAALGSAVMRSVFLPILLVLAALVALKRRAPGAPPVEGQVPIDWKALVVFVLAILAPFSGYLVTGYHDQRYFSITIWVAELFALGWIARSGVPYVRVLFVALAVTAVSLTVVRPFVAGGRTPLASYRRQLDRSPVDTLVGCLQRAGANPSNAVLFQLSRTLLPTPWTFGALSGWRTLPLPTNWRWLDRADRESFMRRFKATYVVGDPVLDAGSGTIMTVPVACSIPLARVVTVSATVLPGVR